MFFKPSSLKLALIGALVWQLFATPAYANSGVYNQLPSDFKIVNRFSELYNPPIHNKDNVIKMPQLVDELSGKMVVMVGEIHNQYEQHIAQFALLKKLHQRNKNIGISVEWVQKKYQAVLDAYLKDEITLQQFITQSKYEDHWGYDIRMFLPVFEYAKRNSIPIYAIDSPKRIQREIYYKGIEGLNVEDKQYLPRNIVELSESQYLELEHAMRVHQVSQQKVKNLVKAHQVRDSALTENMLTAMNDGRHSQMIVFAGVNHILSERGISHILSKRLGNQNYVNVSVQSKEGLKKRYETKYVIESPQLFVMN